MNSENFKVLTQNIKFQRGPSHHGCELVMEDKYENQSTTVNTQPALAGQNCNYCVIIIMIISLSLSLNYETESSLLSQSGLKAPGK